MPKTKVKQSTCGTCGVDVRENTLFCYSCGRSVAETAAVEHVPESEANGAAPDADVATQDALAELAERFKIEEVEDDGKLAKAAAERKKARTKQRQPTEFVWEPAENSSIRVVVLLTILIAVIAGAAVFLTVFRR